MEENKVLEQEEKKKEIKRQMLEIYKGYQEPDGNSVRTISYYNKLVFQNEQGHALPALTDVYPVGIDGTRKMERNRIVLYQEGREIAVIDENSNIIFSEEYLMQMKELSPEIYILLQQINGQHYDLPPLGQEYPELPDIGDELQVDDFALTKEELELEAQRDEERSEEEIEGRTEEKTEEEKKEEQEEPKNEEENIEQIARASGLTTDDIKSCSSIDPQEKITDAESFENIANVTGQYTKIFVVASNSQSRDNSRFGFWGLTPDGQVEQIPGLEERQGVNTGKSIYAINRDGSEVKEQQTSALFTLPNQKEGFSVTIGQYGIVETTYIRKSPTENKFIGSTINSSTQKPTTREVQEFMNDSRTTDTELQACIEDAEHELSETEQTHIRNIDDNSNNDVAIDIDQDVELHDGTTTTLRQEAEKLDISPEDYTREFEEAEGDCPSDKIEAIRLEHEEQEAENTRGERLTPEEEALQRRGY